jgi:hypothetical protein
MDTELAKSLRSKAPGGVTSSYTRDGERGQVPRGSRWYRFYWDSSGFMGLSGSVPMSLKFGLGRKMFQVLPGNKNTFLTIRSEYFEFLQRRETYRRYRGRTAINQPLTRWKRTGRERCVGW